MALFSPTSQTKSKWCDRNLTKGPSSNIEVGLSKEKPAVWKVYSRRNKVGSGGEKKKLVSEVANLPIGALSTWIGVDSV
ncbi:hypothetical protein Lal_00044679 [Lupinus albus]|nr:hypothetical protein Lal_00044679 [Lupinus albus]